MIWQFQSLAISEFDNLKMFTITSIEPAGTEGKSRAQLIELISQLQEGNRQLK